jgi:DNA repair protein RecN (Recombination protein N)
MLSELRIKNFAIIEDLKVNFSAGLNVLTGETGAGKSIIIEALGLALGERASSDMIRAGCSDAHVEAIFEHEDNDILKELAINDDLLIIRRTLSCHGKSRCYINDTSVSLQTLEDLGRELIDTYGQHKHQGLLKKENHIHLIDSIGNLSEEIKNFKDLYNEVTELTSRLEDLKKRFHNREQKIEFLRFQIKEIESSDLKPNEKEEIQEEMKLLLNSTRLRELTEKAYDLLYDSKDSCIEQFSIVNSMMKELARLDSKADNVLGQSESILSQIKDLSIEIRSLRDKYDADPKRLEILNERLDIIKGIHKKYGSTIDEIMRYKDEAERELRELLNIEEQQRAIEEELVKKERELILKAEELSKKRQVIAKKIEKQVASELNELGFDKAKLIALFSKKEKVTATGIDDVEFLFGAHPEELPRPLIRVASGGELSRIMLALKCIEIMETENRTNKIDSSSCCDKTLIFDEVDAGIGGITAHYVGKKLKSLSKRYQVICVTHLPQIAALANTHLKVQKSIADGRTHLKVEKISGKERKEELARMLSGRITEKSIKHAEELLSG